MKLSIKYKIIKAIVVIATLNLLVIVGVDILHYKSSPFMIITNLISLLIIIVLLLLILIKDEDENRDFYK